MKNPEIYIGFTVVSDEEDGHDRVSTFDGIFYRGLDDLQVTGVEDVLGEEFGEEWDALKRKMRKRLTAMGYGVAIANGEDPAKVEAMRDLAKGQAKKQ